MYHKLKIMNIWWCSTSHVHIKFHETQSLVWRWVEADTQT